MPIFYQQQINEDTRLAIWKIEETEEFFKHNVPLHRDVTHPHKRLQHLAGRFLLQFLFPSFPYELIELADTRKPFIKGDPFHFSISHCGDYAAAIVSRSRRVGMDVEVPSMKLEKLMDKYSSADERKQLFKNESPDMNALAIIWCAKESVFKWYGEGGVDFKRDIVLSAISGEHSLRTRFEKTGEELTICYHDFGELVLTWMVS